MDVSKIKNKVIVILLLNLCFVFHIKTEEYAVTILKSIVNNTKDVVNYVVSNIPDEQKKYYGYGALALAAWVYYSKFIKRDPNLETNIRRGLEETFSRRLNEMENKRAEELKRYHEENADKLKKNDEEWNKKFEMFKGDVNKKGKLYRSSNGTVKDITDAYLSKYNKKD